MSVREQDYQVGLILQSPKGSGGVHVHVLDPWQKETLNPLPLSSRLKSMSTMPFVYIYNCMYVSQFQ